MSDLEKIFIPPGFNNNFTWAIDRYALKQDNEIVGVVYEFTNTGKSLTAKPEKDRFVFSYVPGWDEKPVEIKSVKLRKGGVRAETSDFVQPTAKQASRFGVGKSGEHGILVELSPETHGVLTIRDMKSGFHGDPHLVVKTTIDLRSGDFVSQWPILQLQDQLIPAAKPFHKLHNYVKALKW